MTSLAEHMSAMIAALPTMTERDRTFAESLRQQYGRRGSLSDKQWAWVERLARPRPAAPAAQQVGSVAGVLALIARAAEHLRHPKITLATPSGRRVEVSVAGARSKAPGSLNVTDGGRYGENTWYGRVSPDGTWTPSNRAIDADEVGSLLRRLADDPAGTAAEYGRLTGHCCFCRRRLDDERSTAVGYGPRCAERWNLPWPRTHGALRNTDGNSIYIATSAPEASGALAL